jgi:hypothetical protein
MRPGNHAATGGLLIADGPTVVRLIDSVESLEDFALLASRVLDTVTADF